MKLIDIGICVDNKDPRGLGRIRFVRYTDYVGELENAVQYEQWDDKDVFIAQPFLPVNINMIPEIGQAIKIINYDNEKETVNTEYIAGPFTTSHDFKNQTHSNQVENTSYGVFAKHGENVFDKNGNYRESKAVGSLAKNSDYGLYGKYGSDIIFTDDGLHIRGGKLISKPYANINQKEKLINHPIMSANDKIASLHLKKYPKKLNYIETEVVEEKIETGQVKHFVEYSLESNHPNKIIDFTGETITISFYVYNTEKAGKQYRIENPKLEDVITAGFSGCTLINQSSAQYNNNPNFTNTDPTFTITTTGKTETFVALRNTLSKIGKSGLTTFNPLYKQNALHPFYFRPTKEFWERDLGETGYGKLNSNRAEIYNNTGYFQKVGKGLIYSRTSSLVPVKKNKKKVKLLKDEGNREEQTFASVKSDKIYLLSTDPNPNVIDYKSQKPIDFNKLDVYENSQKNYLEDIEPNTYALVRGEILIDILETMAKLFESHIHGFYTPLIPTDPNFIDLKGKILNLKNTLLSKSIRIN